MTFKAPYLTYKEVNSKAEQFLAEYHPSFELPIPIENIVDVKLGIHIYPHPRLYKDLGLNGFLTGDRKTIYIDEVQYDQYYEKFRFTLAHELCHYLLHKSCYKDLKYSSPAEYAEWRMSLSSYEIEWFEKHGDWFAGCVLVPSKRLKGICIEVIEKNKDSLSQLPNIPDEFWSFASNEVARYFQISPITAEIRIEKELIPTKIKITDHI